MDCGEKFPYALLTFPKKLIAGLVPPTPSKNCPRWLPNTPTPSPQVVPAVYPSTTRPAPTHTPTHTPIHPLYTSYTPTTHQIYTTPYLSSCELTATKWGKTGRFLAHEVLECSLRPRMGPNVHEVDTAHRTNKARACSMSVCCERGGANEGGWGGFLRILPSLRKKPHK